MTFKERLRKSAARASDQGFVVFFRNTLIASCMTMQCVSVMYLCASNGAACVDKTLLLFSYRKTCLQIEWFVCIHGLVLKGFSLYHWVVLDLTLDNFACRKLLTTWRV